MRHPVRKYPFGEHERAPAFIEIPNATRAGIGAGTIHVGPAQRRKPNAIINSGRFLTMPDLVRVVPLRTVDHTRGAGKKYRCGYLGKVKSGEIDGAAKSLVFGNDPAK